MEETLGCFSDLYNGLDVVLLANVFEKFRNVYLYTNEPDPPILSHNSRFGL